MMKKGAECLNCPRNSSHCLLTERALPRRSTKTFDSTLQLDLVVPMSGDLEAQASRESNQMRPDAAEFVPSVTKQQVCVRLMKTNIKM